MPSYNPGGDESRPGEGGAAAARASGVGATTTGKFSGFGNNNSGFNDPSNRGYTPPTNQWGGGASPPKDPPRDDPRPDPLAGQDKRYIGPLEETILLATEWDADRDAIDGMTAREAAAKAKAIMRANDYNMLNNALGVHPLAKLSKIVGGLFGEESGEDGAEPTGLWGLITGEYTGNEVIDAAINRGYQDRRTDAEGNLYSDRHAGGGAPSQQAYTGRADTAPPPPEDETPDDGQTSFQDKLADIAGGTPARAPYNYDFGEDEIIGLWVPDWMKWMYGQNVTPGREEPDAGQAAL